MVGAPNKGKQMQEKIENLTYEDTARLIDLCIQMTYALPERNEAAVSNVELGRERLKDILQWLKDKTFVE